MIMFISLRVMFIIKINDQIVFIKQITKGLSALKNLIREFTHDRVGK